METEKGLVRTTEVRLPKFVQDAYDTIEGMNAFANMLLSSKLVPDHFYEKNPEKKPDYTKGKTAAVVVVLLQAQQLQIPPMTALQHIIPVNGLLSIKGDLAKSMIFNSGKLRKDSWKEVVTGSIEEENMSVTITATRDDNGITMIKSFSVEEAKRAGLWITAQQVSGQDGWKYKASAWWKYPKRMLMYRPLGFLARDLFSDVLNNLPTTEEAIDMPRDVTEVIETADGNKITIPDKEHAAKRSGKMTDRVVDKIPVDKFAPIPNKNITDATVVDDKKDSAITHMESDKTIHVNNPDPNKRFSEQGDNILKEAMHQIDNRVESPFIPTKESVEYMNGVKIERNPDGSIKEDEVPGRYTLEGMEKMDTKILLQMVNEDMDMMEASQIMPGKNTNKKLRDIIFAHQQGKLAELVAPYMKQDNEITEVDFEATPADGQDEIPINKLFDQQGPAKQGTPVGNADVLLEDKPKNKYAIDIPELPAEGKREFAEVKRIYNQMLNITPAFDNARYTELGGKAGLLGAFPDRESFIKSATTKAINDLLNKN